jgi:hypothetical protein
MRPVKARGDGDVGQCCGDVASVVSENSNSFYKESLQPAEHSFQEGLRAEQRMSVVLNPTRKSPYAFKTRLSTEGQSP